MTFVIYFSVLLLVGEVCSQETGSTGATETQTSTGAFTSNVDWDLLTENVTPTDVSRRRKTGRLLPQTDPQYESKYVPYSSQPYGSRLRDDKESSPRYYLNSEVFTDKPSSSEAYSPNSEASRYASLNIMRQMPQIVYYPQQFNPNANRDAYQYTAPVNSIYKPGYSDDKSRLNLTDTIFSVHPGFAAARVYRRERFPIPFGNIQDRDYILANDPSIVNVGNNVPFVPYPIPPFFFPPPVPTTSDEEGVDIVLRPSYFDRESGSDREEFVPSRKEQAEESPILEQKEDLDGAFAETSAPAEPIPSQFLPRRPLPVGAYPYGIPPPEIFPPFPYPTGPMPLPRPMPVPGIVPIPPTIPPTLLPPAPADENLLNSYMQRPPNAPVSPIESENLPDDQTIPTEDRTEATEEYDDNNANIPYEFGYEMNDGRGTDQHRKEVADGNGAVSGSYGYRDPFGMYRVVNYIADKNGFRAFVRSNEPGVANPGSADVTVVAEVPPPDVIAEGLRTLKVTAIEVPDEVLEPVAEIAEKK